jgi:hypothetical protein
VNRFQSVLSSRKLQQALPWIAGGVLALGVITFLQVLNRPEQEAVPPTQNRPAQIAKEPKTVPPSPEARRLVSQFLNTAVDRDGSEAVARRKLDRAWQISSPNVRGGLTKREWLTGNIPVVPYDVSNVDRAPVRLDWSYATEASFAVMLLPKNGSAEKPQTFFITVKKFGKGPKARWMVDYFAPYAPPVIPDAMTD